MGRTSRSVTALILLLVAALASAETVRVVGNRIFIAVTIEGVATEALLDSGAEMTLVDTAFAERLGLVLEGDEVARGTGGEQPTQFAPGLDIESAGTRLEDITVAVLDLTDVSRRLVGEPVTIVLGRELFDSGRFVLDIAREHIERVGDDHAPAGTPLPLRDHRGIKQFPIGIEGIGTWADFDLGNGNEMLVGHAFADRHGWLAPERNAGTRRGGGLGGELVRQLVRLQSVRIDGVDLGGTIAAVDATSRAADANIGVEMLRHFVITIDFPGDSIWFAPAESPENARPAP